MLGKLTIINDELDKAMRKHGIEHAKDVKLAILAN